MELDEGVPVVGKCHDDTKGKIALVAFVWGSRTASYGYPKHPCWFKELHQTRSISHGPKYAEFWPPLLACLVSRAESNMEETPRQDESDLISTEVVYR